MLRLWPVSGCSNPQMPSRGSPAPARKVASPTLPRPARRFVPFAGLHLWGGGIFVAAAGSSPADDLLPHQRAAARFARRLPFDASRMRPARPGHHRRNGQIAARKGTHGRWVCAPPLPAASFTPRGEGWGEGQGRVTAWHRCVTAATAKAARQRLHLPSAPALSRRPVLAPAPHPSPLPIAKDDGERGREGTQSMLQRLSQMLYKTRAAAQAAFTPREVLSCP